MKRILSGFIAFAMLLSSFVITFAEEKAELVYSYSFENGMGDWEYRDKKDSMEYARISDICATEGAKSLHIRDISDSSAIGVLSPLIPVTSGETYSASVDLYVKSGTVKLHFKYYDKDGKQLFNQSRGGKEGEWKNLVYTEKAPAKAVTCQVVLSSDSGQYGEGFYDNVKVFKGKVTPYEIKGANIPPEKVTVEEPEDGVLEGTVLYYNSFEDDLEKWDLYSEASDGKIKIVSDALTGKKAVSITDEADNTTAGIKTELIPITPGATYTAMASMKNIKGKSTNLYFKFFGANKKQLTAKSAGHSNTTWQTVKVTYTAPMDAKYCQIQLVGTIAAVGEAYLDDVYLYKGKVTIEKERGDYIPPLQREPVKSKIVEPIDGKLKYNAYNEKGDILGDYSYAGFYGGNYNLPETKNLNVVATLSPTGTGEDTDMIQAAIDKAERKDGGINVIKLNQGKYYIGTKGLRLKSGVLLSGSGQGPEGTIIYAYVDKQYKAMHISGAAYVELATTAKITDDYVKSGSRTLNISPEQAQFFHPGDEIVVVHDSTEKWAEAIKMVGTINVYDDITTWKPGTVNMHAERTITKINGTEITLDIPLYVPHMKELVPSYVAKIRDAERVENAGVENLRFESYFNGEKDDEVHATSAIQIGYAKNIFVRDISAKYFYFSLVTCSKGARQVTVTNCSSLEPVSKVAGARRYAFCSSTGSQQILMSGCYSYDSRHDYATSGQAYGPIVYLDSVVEMSNTSSEAHGVWTNGLLYDNIYHIGNSSVSFSALANRGIYGTVYSQGWTAAGSVIWNTLSSTILVHKPPLTYQNFAVGIWGLYSDSAAQNMKAKNIQNFKRAYRTGEVMKGRDENFVTDENTSIVGDSYKEALYSPVVPHSLFKAQLAERYTGNIANERPNAPILINPFPDSLVKSNNVSVKGIYKLGATKVTVYIDDIAYEAKLNNENYTFEVTANLSDGTHKIYATQVMGGVEGNKTADRFVTVNKSNGNHDYLQSIYTSDKTTLLLNDPRVTYDKIIDGIKVQINKRLLYSDVAPVEISGRVLVPMRAIFERFGAEITWDDKTASATAKSGEIEIKITENSTAAFVNGKAVKLDVPATIINGRFVVPVRFVSESFGAKVDWEDQSKTVKIEKQW